MTLQQLLGRRKTREELPPLALKPAAVGAYDLYPTSPVPSGSTSRGFQAIAERLSGCQVIRIDGFGGVFGDDFGENPHASLAEIGMEPKWVDVSLALRQESEIDRLAIPCPTEPKSTYSRFYFFKMYDWQRMDLEGKPRPFNIDRAMENLHFDREGARITQEFVSHPVELSHDDDWRLVHLPTHNKHFYDVHRIEFDAEIESQTGASPHVLSLVGGSSVIVESKNGMRQQFSYAATFVVRAAAESYRLSNAGPRRSDGR